MVNELEDFFTDLQKRKIITNVANPDNFYQLEPSEKVIYLGIDCTSEKLHIGHLFQFIQTVRFAKKGFTILLVLGGATSKIGDPSDKDKERPLLAEEDIENYQEKIKSQLEKILIKPKKVEKIDFSPLEQFYSDNPELLKEIYQKLNLNQDDAKEKQWVNYLRYIWPFWPISSFGSEVKAAARFRILNNKDWLEKMNFIDFLRQTGKYLTIAYLSKKETIEKRINTGLSFLEFSYPLIQAYDFYYLYQNYSCRGQLGGSDQWGNLTTGLELIRKRCSKKGQVSKAFAFNFPLLTDKEGKKFSKSGNSKNILWLNGAKKDFFEFFRNMTDEQAKVYIKQFTFLEERQIEKLIEINNKSPKLRILQRILYELIYWLNYGEIKSSAIISKYSQIT